MPSSIDSSLNATPVAIRPKCSGVYRIRNIRDGKVYIGSAVNLARRISDHLKLLRRRSHHNKKLQNAWDKYGESVFAFEVILVCDKENLLLYEQIAIDAYSAATKGYNIRLIAESNLGMKMSADAIAKTRAALCGVQKSPEHREKLAAAHRGKKASPETIAKLKLKTMSLESRAKVSAANKGKKVSAETRGKISATQTGRPRTPETKLKLSIANTGKRMPADVRMRISDALTGRKMAPEAVEKAAASHRGKRRSPEAIENMRRGWEKRKEALRLNPDLMKHSEATKAKMSAAKRMRDKLASISSDPSGDHI